MPSVNDFFRNIDLFVLASRHDEGYGLVVAEAMANYLPVVITNSGGAVEIVQDGINGFIVPKSNAEMMAEKIAMLASDVVLCKQMGNAGRKRIEEKFNIHSQAAELENELMRISKK